MGIPIRNQRVPANDPGVALTDTQSQGASALMMAQIKDALLTDRVVESTKILHRASIESLYVLVSVPVSRFATWSLVPVPVVSYRVATNQTLELNGLALSFSESVLMQSRTVGWRLTIDGVRVSNFLGTPAVGFPAPGTIADEYSLGGVGSPSRPISINPVWVQANALVQLEVIDLSGAIDEYVSATGVLSGHLYLNVGGSI